MHIEMHKMAPHISVVMWKVEIFASGRRSILDLANFLEKVIFYYYFSFNFKYLTATLVDSPISGCFPMLPMAEKKLIVLMMLGSHQF